MKENRDNYFTETQLKYYEDVYKPELQNELSKQEPRKKITKISLGQELGRGSFGAVFQAIDLTNGIPIAVKQVKFKFIKGQGDQEKKLKDLEHEIRLLRSLTHKNIVKYLGS